MAGDLEAVEDLLAGELRDSAHEVWTIDELDQHIRRALLLYSQANPVKTSAVLESIADTYEYPLVEVEDEVPVCRLPPYYFGIVDVWYPWEEGQSVFPLPRPDAWSLLTSDVLLIRSRRRPSGGNDCKLRVFYTTGYTIAGLDGAEAGTLPAEGEALVVLGASAYSAMQRAQDAVARVYPNAGTPAELRAWGEARLKQFEEQLAVLRRKNNLDGDARVKLG
jgi:hypothetical protein